MLDLNSTRGKLINAALSLAASKGWNAVTLADIAAAAAVPLADLRNEFASKATILTAFTRLTDDAVLRKVQAGDTSGNTRDRLFDVIMTRFELMSAHKDALKTIVYDLRTSPGAAFAQLSPALTSQHWMLAGAGVNTSGLRGSLRAKGLLAIYARVFDVWLHDDDPGMARTMAALDRQLRQAESAVRRVDDVWQACARMLRDIRHSTRRRAATSSSEAPDNGFNASGNLGTDNV